MLIDAIHCHKRTSSGLLFVVKEALDKLQTYVN